MLLEAQAITRAFGNFKAVDAASVTLQQGDILGLIGPNGAGKSTFFNCLTGDLSSTSGRFFSKVATLPALRRKFARSLGWRVPSRCRKPSRACRWWKT